MKKRILGVVLGAALIFGSFTLLTESVQAQEESLCASGFGCGKKGNWQLVENDTAHACVKGRPKNCQITGGSVPIGS